MATGNDPIRHPTDALSQILSRSYYERRAKMRLGAASPEERLMILRRAVDEAGLSDVDSMLRLRMAVECFTAGLRDTGENPETVLISVKTIVRQRRDLASLMMRDQISEWCIEEFFENEKSQGQKVVPPPEGVS